MIQPIWKKIYVDLGNADSVEYVISYSTGVSLVTIYHGKAWKTPGESSISISINDICANWLSNAFPSLTEGFFHTDKIYLEFVVQTISAAGIYTEVARVNFINDWSYDQEHNPETDVLASPINRRIDRRQKLLWTSAGTSAIELELVMADGSSSTQTFNIFAKGTAVFTPLQWGDVAHVIINGQQYDIVDTCSRYVLYYLNAYGGWDSLLIEGAASEEDSLTKHSMSKPGVYDREKANYLNEIEKKITLHTSWLSDEQSLKMHHLLNSTDVYLHDLDKNVILPVILDNSSTPYKTFKGEGGKLVNYTIEVSVAQTRKRR